MKRILLPLSLALIATAGHAQLGVLTNGGFESWTNSVIYNTPATWTSSNQNEWYGTALCTKSNDAQHLSHSILLENEVLSGDSLFGYAFLGMPSEADLTGFPYTSAFDAVTGFYKCNTVGNDTAFVIVSKSFGGVPYPPVFGAIYGNVSSWTAFTFPVPTGPCDSVFVGFVSSNPFDGSNFNPNTWAMFDNVSFTNTGPTPAALPNPSFETWTDVSINDPDNWDTYNTLMVSTGTINVEQTTDAAAGTYAAQLSTYYIPTWGDTIPGVLTNGIIDPMAGISTIPYAAEPANFSGQYKYVMSGTDLAEVQVLFLQAGSTIGGFYLP
ncbi:MAG TPA: hypothetical protein VK177_15545, partial [Flavobacteriales bacterium]|nr:hypothetical protein [Flavobacteriales bacterium]